MEANLPKAPVFPATVVVIGPTDSGKTNFIFHLMSPRTRTQTGPRGKGFFIRNLRGLRSSAGDPIETDYSAHLVNTTNKIPLIMINTPGAMYWRKSVFAACTQVVEKRVDFSGGLCSSLCCSGRIF
jgi:hypothetical protein